MSRWKHNLQSLFSGAAGTYEFVQNPATAGPWLSKLFDPQTTSLVQFFNTLFKTMIVVGATLAVMRLGYAGIMYMVTDLPGMKTSAKSIISNAIVGLLLLVSIWLILNQINPQLLNLDVLRRASPAPTAPTSGAQQQVQWCAPTNVFGGGTRCFNTLQECNAGRGTLTTCVQGVQAP